MGIHENHKRNVWTTSSGNSCKKLTHTMFKKLWMLPSQTNTRIVVTYVETYFIHIVSGIFWNWLCFTWTCRSSDESIKNVLWKITTDWERKLYCGITMKWDYTKRYVDISMLGYVKEPLHQLNNETPKNPQHQPYPVLERTYDADSEVMKPINT